MGVQLGVALAGVVPAALMLRAAIRGRTRTMLIWLGLGLGVYLPWGVLNDAAVHGWSKLAVF